MYSHVLVVGQHLRLSLRQPRQSHRSQHRRLRGDANGRRKILNEKKKKRIAIINSIIRRPQTDFLKFNFQTSENKKRASGQIQFQIPFWFHAWQVFLLFSFDKKSRTQFLIELYFCMS